MGSREQRERVYVFEPPNDGRDEIFITWLQRGATRKSWFSRRAIANVT
ncbi:MAG: hypothetical protein SWZ49_04175 [Cyanobacteriota bacterium]|nr:hypothetical protein [Cyanobacteriota bacterium]